MYGHVYSRRVRHTAWTKWTLVRQGVNIIHRKSGLLARKVTITQRGNFQYHITE